jgi:hypothetical protein
VSLYASDSAFLLPERVTPTNAEFLRNTEIAEERQSFTEFFSVVLCAFSV